jgi:Ca2+-binding EF-hand superfamily protein
MPVFIQVGIFQAEHPGPYSATISIDEASEVANHLLHSCYELHEQLYVSFSKFDSKRIGKIQVSTLPKFMADIGTEVSEQFIQKASQQLDINCDGRIYYE